MNIQSLPQPDTVERIIKSKETLMGPRHGDDQKLKFYWHQLEMTQKTYSGVAGSACTPHCQNIQDVGNQQLIPWSWFFHFGASVWAEWVWRWQEGAGAMELNSKLRPEFLPSPGAISCVFASFRAGLTEVIKHCQAGHQLLLFLIFFSL